jgi:hypothetical protein
MWIFSMEFLGLVWLPVIALLAILLWRGRVWLDRWAEGMIASFPELLQVGQEKPIEGGRNSAPSPHAKTVNSTAALDGRTRHGTAKHHFGQSANAEPASASPAEERVRGD